MCFASDKPEHRPVYIPRVSLSTTPLRYQRMEAEPTSRKKRKTVTLRTLADYVGVAPCSISAVLNDSPASKGIPLRTRERIFRAAAKFSYAPNQAARALRTRRTRSVAVVLRGMDHWFVGDVLAAIDRTASLRGYILVLATWDGTTVDFTSTVAKLRQRGIEGILLVDSACEMELNLPLVSLQLHLLGPLADRCSLLQQAGEMTVKLIDDVEQACQKTQSFH